MNEIYHYPFLCVGWFGLFVTALNLMPVGQLDGGHILYAVAGSKIHGKIARGFFIVLIVLGILGFTHILGRQFYFSTVGWLLWAAILYFFIKLDHPPVPDPSPLSENRKLLGWVMLVFFILTFPPVPFSDDTMFQ